MVSVYDTGSRQIVQIGAAVVANCLRVCFTSDTEYGDEWVKRTARIEIEVSSLVGLDTAVSERLGELVTVRIDGGGQRVVLCGRLMWIRVPAYLALPVSSAVTPASHVANALHEYTSKNDYGCAGARETELIVAMAELVLQLAKQGK